ncbi:pfs domain-containing protein [Xylaria acuta]|nr:pfs domain-containing protein [Xylaria acuta]
MNQLCCFPLNLKKPSLNGITRQGSAASDSIKDGTSPDLLNDEGSDYQNRLWRIALVEKRQMLEDTMAKIDPLPKNNSVALSTKLDNLVSLTPESCLQTLSSMYWQNKFSKRMPRLRQIFVNMEPFVASITTIAQTHEVAAVVWGCLTFVMQSIKRFGSFWDQIEAMFQDLSRKLPRFRAYGHILHTPRLHSSLRDVYERFLDFCIKTLRALEGSALHVFVRLQWSPFAAELRSAIDNLDIANREFESELRLADVQQRAEAHKTVMAVLAPLGLVTNVALPRNEKFMGRSEVLDFLHSILEPSCLPKIEDRVACSCLIHATGGMGKTETALEYTYRFRHKFTHVFWLRSNTEQILTDSFLEIISALDLVKEKGISVRRKIQTALRWLQSTDKTWLLIFDNAEDIGTIRPFWPASPRGAIIVTSQNPAIGLITKNRIHLQPLTLDEGSSLLQNILDRGESEKQEAKHLSQLLGGLPLAITHFGGAILRSQCPISQISQSFSRRTHSSQIWTMDDEMSVMRAYENTLNTVWDYAISRLSSDALTLLEFIAFLDPDQIPVDMFVGQSGHHGDRQDDTSVWKHWEGSRFNSAVAVLCERHLFERYQHGRLDALRTHRALQRSILQRLDSNVPKRDAVFKETVSIVKQALPPANFENRADQSLLPIFVKLWPQVIRLHGNFVECESQIPDNLEFATVLHSAAYYAHHGLGQGKLPLSLLETAEQICNSLSLVYPEDARELLINVLSGMGPNQWHLGKKAQAKRVELSRRVIALLAEETGGIPVHQWSQNQHVLFAKAQDDYGWVLTNGNQIEEAEAAFNKSIIHYRMIGKELPQILACCDRLMPLSTRQEKQQVREEAAKYLQDVIRLCGENNPLTLSMQSLVARAHFTIGDIGVALDMYKNTYQRRSLIFGNSHYATLSSQYCLALCLQHSNDLEGCEFQLRSILSITEHGDGWHEEDDMRVRFRLSVVLLAQNRPREAAQIRADMDRYLKTICGTFNEINYSDEQILALIEADIPISRGRTTGIWSNGFAW